METLLVWVIIGIIILVMSKRLRATIFHVQVRRFFLIALVVTGLVVMGIAAYFIWKFWWPEYMARPTVEYFDETIEQDMHPETPGTGGRPKPVIIQTR